MSRPPADTEERPRPLAGAVELERLFEEHADFVRRAVIHLGGPRADVDDLVQEVFLVALRKGGEFEGRSKPSTWLYAIALRVVAAERRRSRLRTLLLLHPPEDRRAPSPAELFEHREASELVYQILDGIAEKKRAVFILFELSGLSGEEIAQIVGCPVKTVWTRLHHARREFTQGLERQRARAERELGRVRRRA